MEVKEAIQILKDHNVWRRFDDENSESPEMTNPKELGIAIDKIVSKFENLFLPSISNESELLSFIEWYIKKPELIGWDFNIIVELYKNDINK